MSRYVSNSIACRFPAAVGSIALVCALLVAPAALAEEAPDPAAPADTAQTQLDAGAAGQPSDDEGADGPTAAPDAAEDAAPAGEPGQGEAAEPGQGEAAEPAGDAGQPAEPEPVDPPAQEAPAQPTTPSEPLDGTQESGPADGGEEGSEDGSAADDPEQDGGEAPSDGGTEPDSPQTPAASEGQDGTDGPADGGTGAQDAAGQQDPRPADDAANAIVTEGQDDGQPAAETPATEAEEGQDPEVGPLSATPSFAYDASTGLFSVQVSGVATPTGVVGVSVGVTAPDGTCRWYALERGSAGFWSTSVSPADFGWQSGTYRVEVSVNDAGWRGNDAGTASYTVSLGAEKTTCTVSDDGSTIVATASGGRVAGAWQVSFQVVGSKGTFWILGTRQADGSYRLEVPSSQVGSGTVTVTPVAALGTTSIWLGSASAAVAPAQVATSLTVDVAGGVLVATADGVTCPTGVVGVSVGVTAPDGTCRWYALAQGGDGSWQARIPLDDFGWQTGAYRVETSVTDADWRGNDAGTASHSVSFGSETVSCTVSDDGSTVVATASGGRVAGAWQVSFQVVGSKGTFWILGTRQADGSYRLEVPSSQVGSGTVTVTPVAALGTSSGWLAASSATVPAPSATTTLSYDQQSSRLVARATGVSCPSGVVGVSVGLVSPNGTTRWFALSQNSDGSWSASIDPAVFAWQTGAYSVTTSITDSSWSGVDMGTQAVRVSYGTESVGASASSDGSQVTLTASGGRTAGAWQLTFEIQGSTGTTWVLGTKQADGSWAVTVPSTQSGGGNLNVTALAYVGDSVLNVGQTSIRTYSQTVELTCTTRPANDDILLEVGGGKIANAWNVSFAVYNVDDGTAGTTWYQATKQADGSWSAAIPASVNGVGTCVVTAWCNVGVDAEVAATGRYTYSVVPTTATSIDLGGGNYNVLYGMSGLKVKAIQEALGVGDPNYPRYLSETQAAVSSFQQRAGLPVTGVVDYDTWIALGLSDYNWTHLGAYASPVQVSASASASERIEAMISRAYDYLGDSYVWDAAGAPGEGVDCAGLVIQSLYAAGLDLGIINPVTHATTSWGDHDAANLYNYGGFTKVSLADRVRGDLIFYSYGGTGIDHVAIYLGNSAIIEAYPNQVQIANLWKAAIVGVSRVFQ